MSAYPGGCAYYFSPFSRFQTESRDIVKEHARLACKPSEVEALLAHAGSKPTSFRR